MRKRNIAICGLPQSTIFFPHYLINGTIFGKKKVIEHKIRVLIFSSNFETFLILRKIEAR